MRVNMLVTCDLSWAGRKTRFRRSVIDIVHFPRLRAHWSTGL